MDLHFLNRFWMDLHFLNWFWMDLHFLNWFWMDLHFLNWFLDGFTRSSARARDRAPRAEGRSGGVAIFLAIFLRRQHGSCNPELILSRKARVRNKYGWLVGWFVEKSQFLLQDLDIMKQNTMV